MSTYESFVESCDYRGEERFVRAIADQNDRIEKFLLEYKRRCDLVQALEEQNYLLKKQIDSYAQENTARRKELDIQIDEATWQLEKVQKELASVNTEAAKYREFIEQLELNNDYLKQQSAETDVRINEAHGKIDSLKDRLALLQAEGEEIQSQTDKVSAEAGSSKTLSLAMNRNVETFEELAREVERQRNENQILLDKISELQTVNKNTETVLQESNEDRLLEEERRLSKAIELKEELDVIRKMTATQEKLIDTIQIDLETLREENAYLTQRVRVRNLSLD